VVEEYMEEERVILHEEELDVPKAVVGPVLEEVRQANGLLDAGPRLSNISENEYVPEIILKKRGAGKIKKPKKGSTSLGAPRCMALKELAVNGKKGRGKEVGEGGVKKSKGGESMEEAKEGCAAIVGGELEVVLPSCSQLPMSGVQFLMNEEEGGVPDTPLEEMRDERGKEVDAERLLGVEKELGITFSMADGRVVDRMVVAKDVDFGRRLPKGTTMGI
jgi:hypothetical protein